MSEWGWDNQVVGELPVSQKKITTGGWKPLLTLVALVLVSGLSFLIAYLTRNIENRSIFIIAATFGIPVGAMFLAALFMEFGNHPMLPQTSRSAQIKVAAIAVAGTILVGGICDAIYLYGGFIRQSQASIVFLIDRSSSMMESCHSGQSTREQEVQRILSELMIQMDDHAEAGLVSFDGDILGAVPLAALDSAQRDRLKAMTVVDRKIGQTAFYLPIKTAVDMVKTSGTKRPARIVLLTDGFEVPTHTENWLNFENRPDEVISLCNAQNTQVYVVAIDAQVDDSLVKVVNGTGGKLLSTSDMNMVLDFMVAASKADGDMIRANTSSAFILSGIMMLLEGLVIGLGMWLLLSTSGQFRFQIVLSPLLAIISFVLLKIVGQELLLPQWILEGISFSLLGLVFMRQNLNVYSGNTSVSSAPPSDFSDTSIW